MIFTATKLPGAFIIDLERHEDERGFFARSWCQKEFAAHGLDGRLVQCNVSYNLKKGTLRGLHLQVAPYAEAKLVRCTRGAIFDVVLDLRPASPSYGKWYGAELSAENGRMLYVPEGCAHGYQTLEEGTEMYYMASEFYAPSAVRGVRFDDPSAQQTIDTLTSEVDRCKRQILKKASPPDENRLGVTASP